MTQFFRSTAALWLLAAAPVLAQAPSAEEIAKSVREVSGVLGMQPKRAVPSETITRDAWRTWLDNELKRKVKPEEIRAQELALKLFGLVPADFDLRKTTIDLYTEQAAAFYDSKKKRMTFVEGALDQTVILTLPHELAHAIADQQFNLDKFLDKDVKSDDAQMARLAVAEGQATWVMFELTVQKVGQSLATNPGLVDQFFRSVGDTTGTVTPVFQGAPLYIQRTLTFPYAQGLLFQQKVVEKLGKPGFTEVLKRPPASTQHILHPDTYFANRQPTEPALPEPQLPKEYKRLIDGVFGELDASLLLEQYLTADVAKTQAELWRGGAYAVMEHKQTRNHVLAWALEWESATAARSFLDLYRRVLEGKNKEITWTEGNGDGLIGQTPAGRFQIRVQGAQVVGLEEAKRDWLDRRPAL